MRSKENGEHNICPHHNKLETIQVGCAEDEAGAAVAEAARSPGEEDSGSVEVEGGPELPGNKPLACPGGGHRHLRGGRCPRLHLRQTAA